LSASSVLVNGTTYYVTQSVGGCVSSNLAITITTFLGNDSFDSKSLSFYPNPTSDILNISYSNTITKVRVTNSIGQEIMVKNPNQNELQIDLSNVAAGVYLLEVTADTVSKIIKVVKK
jgi:hypothetical protein